MTVAVVHDHLVQRGGAERLLLSIARAFPGAPVHTSVYEPAATHPALAALDVTTRPMDRSAFCRHHHRLVAPLLAPTFSRLRLDEDLVVCSSAGWSHGTTATRGAKLAYFHAPARWLYANDDFLAAAGRGVRLAAAATRPGLLRWDRRAAASVDAFVANSTITAERLHDAYGVEAPVVPPPVLIDPDGARRPVPDLTPGFVLTVARLIAYKHVDAVVEAFARRPDDQLVVVGHGPESAAIAAMAGPNVRLLGAVADDQLRWLYANARVLVSAAHEDFGMTPAEAGALGCPVAVLRAGGHLDSVVEGLTGTFFDEPSAEAVAEAIERSDATTWHPASLRAHAAGFDEDGFARRLRTLAADLVGGAALGPSPDQPSRRPIPAAGLEARRGPTVVGSAP